MGEGLELSLREVLGASAGSALLSGPAASFGGQGGFGDMRHSGRRPSPVGHCPMGAGTAGIGSVPGLYPETAPRRRSFASCFPAVGWGAFAAALSRGAMAAASEGRSGLAVDGKVRRGLHGDELPGIAAGGGLFCNFWAGPFRTIKRPCRPAGNSLP